jgi:molybdate/tungstate transport system ATP-binding protein
MIELRNISWNAGEFSLHDVNCVVPEGTYTVLMGQTGCGKTTVIELICGLRRPTSGQVLVGGRDVTRESPGGRGIGYVPQDGALFPKMTVAEQIGFALKIRRRPMDVIVKTVTSLAEELGVSHLLGRKPEGLSGGERQRIALGRALALNPRVLLLDEPLSALDENMRDEMADLLKRTQREHSLTALHITHSSRETEQLADRVLRMEDGKVREVDP